MLLLIDKPRGITSHDVVDAVRRATHERRVGHAGTLDPNATGLLIVAVGRESTKKLGDLTTNTHKTYIGEITLGVRTTTDDSEGDEVERQEVPSISKGKIEETLKTFLGEQEQVPPVYSAIKLNGKKAYDLARKGEAIVMAPRRITVYSIKLLSFDLPRISIECEVSSGTYIRSLAKDIGAALHTVAHLSALRRTKIGEYDIKDAVTLETLQREGVK